MTAGLAEVMTISISANSIADWPLRDVLQHDQSLPVFIDNDTNCGAWAQYLSTREPNQIFINAGIGLGVGIIINGQLYRGTDGIAEEAGHHAISPSGTDCVCGNVGCWEQYASERALARAISHAGYRHSDRAVSFPLPPNFVERVAEQALDGQPQYLAAFDQIAQQFGIGLVNVLNAMPAHSPS